MYVVNNPINFTDPLGAFPGIGTAIGFIAGATGALAGNGGQVNRDVAVAAIAGAAIGTFPPLAMSPIGLTLTGLFGGAVGGAITQIGQPDFELDPVGMGAITGLISGMGGGAVIGLGGTATAATVVSGTLGGFMDVMFNLSRTPRGGQPFKLFSEEPDICKGR